MDLLDNAFPKDQKWKFEYDGRGLTLPFGIHLHTVILTPTLGPEVILVLRKKREFLNELKEFGPLTLNIRSGAARTSAGPIIFTIWWFPPMVNATPYASYELLISPLLIPAIAQVLERASLLTHLHLLILDDKQQVFDLVEFENVYGLGSLLSAARDIGAHLQDYDFDRAKQAFMHEHSLESLMRL